MTQTDPPATATGSTPSTGPRVSAVFLDRKRIVFTARERAFVNVRESLPDGPVGFSSTELLLIAVGNCSLGTLFGHPLLKDAAVSNITADLAATMASDPPRVTRIETTITADVADPELVARQSELEAIACACPMCNSVTAEKQLRVRLTLAPGPA
jgi:uncharacterized OsmC-like protein